MDISLQKRLIRKTMVQRILDVDPAVRRAQEAVLADRFPELAGFESANAVLLYATAFPEEIDTEPMLRLALERGKRLLCPRVDRAERRLRLFRVAELERDLRPGTLGIPEPGPECEEVEPEEVDWVLVPGLAFDERGYRVGRGAGHYDRLLPRLRPEVPRWAIAFDCQWLPPLPIEPHDVPLDGIVSPARTVVRG